MATPGQLPPVADMVDAYLPLLVMAGDYARRIQPSLAPAPAKAGPNPWAQALTDADQSVQTFLEVATLARFPGAGFYGEEQDQSRNAGYFPAAARTVVWLDPIDGTYLYRNQRPGWQIVLSISRDARLEATVCYLPAAGRFNLALRGTGALTGSRDAPRLAAMEPLHTRSGSGLCVTYQAPEELARLGRAFRAFDIVVDDDPGRPFDNLNDLFSGRLDAYAGRSTDLLDWGAIAFMVAQAGGVATALDGSPLDCFEQFGNRQVDLLVASSPAVHARALACLRDQLSKK